MNLLRCIFQENSIQLNFSDFESDFNGYYITKLLICLDEGEIPKKEIEKLKQLSTSDKQQFKEKHIKNEQIDFFGKFILCSNGKNDFIKIDKKENRFCVIDVPKLANENNKLLAEMKQQTNAFVYELLTREIIHADKTRFWFDYQAYETKQTKIIKEDSRQEIDKLFQLFVQEVCDLAGEIEFYMTQSQIHDNFYTQYNNKTIKVSDVEKYLKNEKNIFTDANRRKSPILKNLRDPQPFINQKTGEITEKPLKTENLNGKYYLLKLSDFI